MTMWEDIVYRIECIDFLEEVLLFHCLIHSFLYKARNWKFIKNATYILQDLHKYVGEIQN